jgi:hypothetical protein
MQMTFAYKLKALREKATKEKGFAVTDLERYLVNHAEELEALVRAAERHCVKRMLDDDHELRQALAALNKEKT